LGIGVVPALQDFAKCALSQGITKIRSSGAGIYKQIDKVENFTLAALGARRSGELKAVSEYRRSYRWGKLRFRLL